MALFQLFSTSGAAPIPGQRVLRQEDYAVLVEAADLTREIRERAAEAARRAEEACAEDRRKGYEEGLEEGKAEASGQIMDILTASVEHMASMESSLVDVVMRSVRTILDSFDDRQLATMVVGRALRMAMDQKKVQIRVAAADAAAVEAAIDDYRRRYPGITRIDVVPDASMARGGCVLETDLGVVDATLERQLAIIEEAFRKRFEKNGSGA